MPSYNSEKYIRTAINSVLGQSYTDKELIVVDGASTDGTVEILKEYGNQINWISEKDSGQSDAINKGFRLATGDIVTWLNTDDFYMPEIFQMINDYFVKNKSASIVYGNCRSLTKSEYIINKPADKITSEALINKGNLIYQPASFYRTEDVYSVKMLDKNLYYWMEYDLFIKLLNRSNAVYIDHILTNFTIRPEQKSDLRNLIEMDKEMLQISQKYGGGKIFSRLYIMVQWHKFKHFIK